MFVLSLITINRITRKKQTNINGKSKRQKEKKILFPNRHKSSSNETRANVLMRESIWNEKDK